jgi:hypothetical protein
MKKTPAMSLQMFVRGWEHSWQILAEPVLDGSASPLVPNATLLDHAMLRFRQDLKNGKNQVG